MLLIFSRMENWSTKIVLKRRGWNIYPNLQWLSRLVFNKVPTDNGGLEGLGLANIEPTPDNSGMMHGELYVMDEKFIPKLDEIFGHPDEYQRKVMRFNRHDFILVNGLTYIARPDKIATGLKPSKATMKIFRKAKKLFPMLYFSRLMNTPTCD